MAPSLISTNKNIHAKDKPAELCNHQPQEETASLQPAAFTSDLLKPSPNYRGTSGLSVSLTFLTLFFKKKNTHFLIECHSGRKIGLQFLDLNLLKKLGAFFFLIKAPHNLKKKFTRSIYSVLKHHTYCTGSPWKGPLSAGQPQIPP